MQDEAIGDISMRPIKPKDGVMIKRLKTFMLFIPIVNSIIDTDTSLANVISNGYDIYYNMGDNVNAWLSDKTIKLSGGGELIPQKEWLFYISVMRSMIYI